MSETDEPAIKSYFFGKGYRDLGDTIIDSWNRNIESARDHFGKVGSHLGAGEKHLAVIWATAGISVVLFGTVVFALASAFHVTVLAVFFTLIYLAFSVVFLAERCYLLVKRFSAVCPDCHSKSPLPEYFCSQCDAIHRRLVPSSYGILYHTCTCGQRLPATFFLKRGQLKSRCPNSDCEGSLEERHFYSRKIFIPIVGGPVVGKSAFLFSALSKLIESRLPDLGLSYSFVDRQSESEFELVHQQLTSGLQPSKTVDNLPRALTVEFHRPRSSPRVLYLYDPAGEAFGDTEGLVLHKFQEYLSGLVFLIDPFSIPAVYREYAPSLPTVEKDLRPSQLPIEDALARVLISMEENFGLGKTSRMKVPVAVVLNKIDAFDLEYRIGKAAVSSRLAASPPDTSPQQAQDDLLRDQLIQWDQGDFVQQIESRCSRVRYFTCSSLGRMPDSTGQAFEPRDVLEPLMWILESTDSIFNTQRMKAAA